ncbi:MAG: peptidyl-prolyl cis-trans isomerase [Acidobacteriota bacterium]
MRRIAALVLLTLATAAAAAHGATTLVEGIVVRVNDRILTTADMRMRVIERTAETGRAPAPADYPALVNEAVDELCLLERATELKIEVSDDDVSGAIAQLRENNRVADEQTFQAMLQQMGMTLDQLRRRLRETIGINRVLSREVTQTPITEEELRQRYSREEETFKVPEKVRLEHIVFSVAGDGGDEAAVTSEARRLAAAARADGNFLALVDEQVKAGRGSGGDLGILEQGDLRTEVQTAVVGLKAGEISEPFVTVAGVHVVRVAERIPSSVKPFEEVAEELRLRETSDRNRGRLSDVVAGLKQRYVVEVHPEMFTAPQ